MCGRDADLKKTYGIITTSVTQEEFEPILLPRSVILRQTAKKMNYYVQQDEAYE